MPSTAILLQDIYAGVYDDALRTIGDALRDRQRTVAYENARNLQRGDFVRLVAIRPKYLQGIIVKVVGFSGTKVLVDLPDDYSAGRYRGAKAVKVGQTCVEKVEVAKEVSDVPDTDVALAGFPKPDPKRKLEAIVIKDEDDDPNDETGFVGPVSFRYAGRARAGDAGQWRTFDPNRDPDQWYPLAQVEAIAAHLGVAVEHA